MFFIQCHFRPSHMQASLRFDVVCALILFFPRHGKGLHRRSNMGKNLYLSLYCINLHYMFQCTLGMKDYTKYMPKDMLNSYCYIHSTFIVPRWITVLSSSHNLTIFIQSLYMSRDIFPRSDNEQHETYPGLSAQQTDDEEKAVVHTYYQWVILVLFLQVKKISLSIVLKVHWRYLWLTITNGSYSCCSCR